MKEPTPAWNSWLERGAIVYLSSRFSADADKEALVGNLATALGCNLSTVLWLAKTQSTLQHFTD